MTPIPFDRTEPAVADILIVEDEEAHAEAIEEGLSRMGHACTVVNDLPTALARIQTRRFDIIVTDLVLGSETDGGLKVLAAAVEHAPGTKVILITAHSSVETCRRALQQEAFDYVEKPLDLDEFRVVVSRAAELTAQRRAATHAEAVAAVQSAGYRLGDHKAVRLRYLTDPTCRAVRVYVVSEGLSPADAALLHLLKAPTIVAALADAAIRPGRDSILYVQDAGNLSVIPNTRS